MPIPRYFVNGIIVRDPVGGVFLVELNPPFTQHQTLEILVHIPAAGIELRHYGADGAIRRILLAANNDMIYLTVEPNERLVAHYYAGIAQVTAAQCSLSAF